MLVESRPSTDKASFVLSQCHDGTVLDVGCINHSAETATEQGETWLHHRIRAVARSATGVDFLRADAERLNRRGYDIVVADAEDFDLERTYDVVVAADIIEHLSNIGAFLHCARRHMAETSVLVLTTPNPFALARFISILVRKRVPVNPEHTVWIDPMVLFELLDRHGLEIMHLAWFEDDEDASSSRSSRLLDRVAAPLLKRRPLLRRSYGVVAARKPPVL